MSEIASKPSSGASSSLASPLIKKGADAGQDVIFAALFGGVVAAESDMDSPSIGMMPVSAETNIDANPDGEPDILAAMQAVAAMMAGQKSATKHDTPDEDIELDSDLLGDETSADGDFLGADIAVDAELLSTGDAFDGDFLGADDGTDDILANAALLGGVMTQDPAGKSRPSSRGAAILAPMAEMAYEDEPSVMPQRGTAPSAKIEILDSKANNTGRSQSDQILKGAAEDKDTAPFSAKPVAAKPAGQIAQQQGITPLNVTSNKYGPASVTKVTNMADMSDADGIEFDSPDVFVRAMAGQAERATSRPVTDATSGDTSPTNAARLALASGAGANGQMSQQNNGQSSGQPGNVATAGSAMTNGAMMEMLDMAQDNWTEMLLQRVEKGLAGGKDKIDFHLNPKNLGKMRISLVVQNDRTNVHIQTETSAAAHVLSESEARLAQMMDASGVKFGNLTSQYNQNFGGNFAGQNSRQNQPGDTAKTGSTENADANDMGNAEISVETSENLINMQA